MLDQALGPILDRPVDALDPGVRIILRLGAYQILFLDRVPAHAAVDTAVALATASGGATARAGGLVNAVLRRLSAAPPPTVRDPTRTHPEWLIQRWTARWGDEAVRLLVAWNDEIPRLVVQPARWTMTELEARWAAAGIAVDRAPWDAGLLPDASDPRRLPGFADGGFVVQDAAQQLVVRFVVAGLVPGMTVYDACAAPGGKTIAFARRGLRVIAGEVRRDRLHRLAKNLAWAGAGSEALLLADATAPPLRSVDMVFADLPCLATGTFARHPDARWRITPAHLQNLVAQGRRLLAALAQVVRPGGWLSLATCSLEPEENGEQVDRFLRDHPDFRRDPLPGGWGGEPSGIPASFLTETGDLEIRPQDHGMDGAFAARLRRIG